MKHLLTIALLLVALIVTAQTEPEPTTVSVAKVSNVAGSNGTYTATLTISDVYTTGYTGLAIQAGHKYIEATGKVYEITSVSNPTFTRVNVALTCLTNPAGSPVGTGQVWIPLSSGMYPSAPARDGELGHYLLSLIISHNATISNEQAEAEAAMSYRDTTIALPGLTINATISGPAPVLTGSPGGYLLTTGVDSDVDGLTLTGDPAATASGDLTFTMTGGTRHRSVTLIDGGNGQVIGAPKLEYGILLSRTTTGTTTNYQSLNIGGLTSFILELSR